MPSIAIIDNFDSFTYNLLHALEALGAECTVMRNNAVDWDRLRGSSGIVLGPGPGIPEEAGDLMQVIEAFHVSHALLGVCLGHQALGQYFGSDLTNLSEVYHGCDRGIVWLEEDSINTGLPEAMQVGLYHSWAVDLQPSSLLRALAYSTDDVLMAFRHVDLPIHGIQFHPESVMTPQGRQLLKNWLNGLGC